MFKVYIINGNEAFVGFYPVIQHPVTIGKKPVAINDVLGKDVPLFHFSDSDDEDDLPSQYVAHARSRFESVWSTIARPVDE